MIDGKAVGSRESGRGGGQWVEKLHILVDADKLVLQCWSTSAPIFPTEAVDATGQDGQRIEGLTIKNPFG